MTTDSRTSPAAPPVSAPTRAAVRGAHCAPGLASIDERSWDALVPHGGAALRHRYLAAWENVELAGLSSRPVLSVGADGEPVAACPGYWYDLDLLGTRAPAATNAIRALRRKLPRLAMARTYELGSPTPLTNPFLVPDERLRPAAVAAIAAAAIEEGERGGAHFLLVQNFTSLDGPAAQIFTSLGFTGVPILPTVVVDLPYGSFEEYLAAMRSQYRRRAHQALKRSQTLTVEHRREFAELAEDLAALWRLIYERASELRREVLTPAYFRAMSALEETSVLLLRRPDGSIASFALLLDDRPWLAFLQCGFDAEAGRSEGAYFRLLYEIVRLGIENGFERVELGMTTVPPKLDIGGVPVPLYALLRHRNPLLHRLIGVLANGPMGPPRVEARHVFKEEPPTAAELVAHHR